MIRKTSKWLITAVKFSALLLLFTWIVYQSAIRVLELNPNLLEEVLNESLSNALPESKIDIENLQQRKIRFIPTNYYTIDSFSMSLGNGKHSLEAESISFNIGFLRALFKKIRLGSITFRNPTLKFTIEKSNKQSSQNTPNIEELEKLIYDFAKNFINKTSNDINFRKLLIYNGDIILNSGNVHSKMKILNLQLKRTGYYKTEGYGIDAEFVYNNQIFKISGEVNYDEEVESLDFVLNSNNLELSYLNNLWDDQFLTGNVDLDFVATISHDYTTKVKNLAIFSNNIDYFNPNIFKQSLSCSELNLNVETTSLHDSIYCNSSNLIINNVNIRLDLIKLYFGDKFNLKVDSQVDNLSCEEINNLWPINITPNTRAWITKRIKKGSIEDCSFRFDSRNKIGWLDADLKLTNGSLRYLNKFPTITELDANISFIDDNFMAEVNSAKMLSNNVTDGEVSIKKLNSSKPLMEIRANLEGDAVDIVTALENPLNLNKKSKKDIIVDSGYAKSEVYLFFYFKTEREFRDYNLTAFSELSNINTRNLFGFRMKNGQADFVLKDGQIDCVGDGLLENMTSSFRWQEWIYNDRKINRSFDIKPVLQANYLDSLGVKLPINISGDMKSDIKVIMGKNLNLISGKVDLTKATISEKFTNIAKPFNQRGFVDFAGTFGKSKLNLNKVNLISDSLIMKSELELSFPKIEFRKFKIDTLRYKGSQYHGVISKIDSIINIDLSASRIFIPEIKKLSSSKSEKKKFSLPKFNLTAIIDTISFKHHDMFDFEIKYLPYSKDESAFGLKKDNFLVLKPESDRYSLEFITNNISGLADHYFRIPHFNNGTLEFKMNFDGRHINEAEYELKVKSIDIVDAPDFARYISLATLKSWNVMESGVVPIEYITLDGFYQNNSLNARNFRLGFGGIAVKGDGKYSLGDDDLNFDGYIVYMDDTSRLLNKIPIIDKIIGNGFFATHYKLTGKISQPEIDVNPLSTITPAFIRDIIDSF